MSRLKPCCRRHADRPPSLPQNVRRLDNCCSNVTHDVCNTSPVRPLHGTISSPDTHFCMFLCLSFVLNLPLLCQFFLFYLSYRTSSVTAFSSTLRPAVAPLDTTHRCFHLDTKRFCQPHRALLSPARPTLHSFPSLFSLFLLIPACSVLVIPLWTRHIITSSPASGLAKGRQPWPSLFFLSVCFSTLTRSMNDKLNQCTVIRHSIS